MEQSEKLLIIKLIVLDALQKNHLLLLKNNMKRLTHNRKTLNNLLLQNLILYTILIFSLSYGVVEVMREKVISPCAGESCFVKTVYASEETTEVEQIVSYIAKVFGPDKRVVQQALKIAECESHWNTKAYNFNTNGSGDYSIFQINSVHIRRYGTKFMTDWRENVRVAFDLYKHQGWSPWVCKI